MEEPQDTIPKSFRIYPKHVEYLEKINENINLALRITLDKAIQEEKHSKIKTTVDRSMVYICFGLLFFLFAVILDGFVIVIPLFIGIVVLMYGLIGGVTVALSGTRRRT